MKSGAGYLIGIAISGAFVLIMWGIRPMVAPRHGVWVGDIYWVEGADCGHINDMRGIGYWEAFGNPSITSGLGGYDHTQTRDEAVAEIEKWCR